MSTWAWPAASLLEHGFWLFLEGPCATGWGCSWHCASWPCGISLVLRAFVSTVPCSSFIFLRLLLSWLARFVHAVHYESHGVRSGFRFPQSFSCSSINTSPSMHPPSVPAYLCLGNLACLFAVCGLYSGCGLEVRFGMDRYSSEEEGDLLPMPLFNLL